MKRLLAFFFAILLLISTAACSNISGYHVPEPLQYPDYTFKGTPTTDELRQTAVRAMRDLLSVQWFTAEDIGYNKEGSKKFFQHTKETLFGGVLYTGASSGMFQYLEFYNQKTGELDYPGTDDEMKEAIGSACADTLLWAWSTVCTSYTGGYFPATMVVNNGYVPVGDYTYNFGIDTFYKHPTDQIVKKNGTSVMTESYAKMLPADALISSTDNHALMVIEAPVVVRRANGSINAKDSYVMIQDQRGGIGAGFYDVEHEDYTVHHNGRISQQFTFAELMEKNYIPVTAKEFIGEKAYEKATVTASGGDSKAFSDISKITVSSNYPLAVVRLIVTDADGKESELEKILFHAYDKEGPAKEYELSELTKLSYINPVVAKCIRVEVTVSTGETFTPVDIK